MLCGACVWMLIVSFLDFAQCFWYYYPLRVDRTVSEHDCVFLWQNLKCCHFLFSKNYLTFSLLRYSAKCLPIEFELGDIKTKWQASGVRKHLQLRRQRGRECLLLFSDVHGNFELRMKKKTQSKEYRRIQNSRKDKQFSIAQWLQLLLLTTVFTVRLLQLQLLWTECEKENS